MLRSIEKSLPNYALSVAALFIGQQAEVDLSNFCLPVTRINTYKNFLPISESRNICQAYLQQKMKAHGGLGWILDDDLHWVMSEEKFSKLCDLLLSLGCDMAFSALDGDAPIPKEYTRASPLLDVLLELVNQQTLPISLEMNTFLEGVCVAGELTHKVHGHHDYYAYNKQSFYKATVDTKALDWNDFINRLYIGKKTTRSVLTPKKVTLATGRERGGATLILNPNILNCRNESFKYSHLISRRSDMIMGTTSREKGFVSYNTPAVFSHNRDNTFDTHDSRKLIGDILGYAFVESKLLGSYCHYRFAKKFSNRLHVTQTILHETSTMLMMLKEWLVEQEKVDDTTQQIIDNIISENTKSLLHIQSLNLEDAMTDFELFLHSRIENERFELYQ